MLLLLVVVAVVVLVTVMVSSRLKDSESHFMLHSTLYADS